MSTPLPLTELPLPTDTEPPAAVPPPRFDEATFESYLPGNDSQARACERVREFSARSVSASRRGLWPWRRAREGSGLYLDGGYGVGKTHLLAAAFHALDDDNKAYLTFQQLVHLIGAVGMEGAHEHFRGLRLLCLDEFELDDPGNTLLVKRFLEPLFEAGGAVLTTSNTPPEAQGQGRFNAEDFRREIQGIASRFEALRVEGSDYRGRGKPPELPGEAVLRRDVATGLGEEPLVTGSLRDLLAVLGQLHPVRFRDLLARIGTLYLFEVETIDNQNDALRFVHFIDQLYDQRVGLRMTGNIGLGDLFDPAYRSGAYSRKHERCISRLGELIEEPLEVVESERAQGFD